MGSKQPRVTANQIVKVIEEQGFVRVRASGSHLIYKNRAGSRVTVPFHGATVLHPKILKSILRDADLSVEDLNLKKL